MHDESFGRRLRQERERRQIALSSISQNTKISVALFEALERDDVSRWPSGIFRRAFIRSYAQAIGLDPDATLKEFLDRFPEPGEGAASNTGDASNSGTASDVLASPADPLRLTLEETAGVRRWLGDPDRWAAVAWDVGAVTALALTVFMVLGVFWMPLGVSSLMYFVGGAFVFGTTPGVFLFSNLPVSSRQSWFGRRRSPSPSTGEATTGTVSEAPARPAAGTRVAVRLVRGRRHGGPRVPAADSVEAEAPFELHAVSSPGDRRASL